MKNTALLLFLCLGIVSVGISNEDHFNRRYIEASVHLVATDIREALRVADSLSSTARTDEQRIKALMLTANIHYHMGNLPVALREAVKADKVANVTLNPAWQSVTSGFLATTFRHVGLLTSSKYYLQQADQANERQPQSDNYLLTKINIEHEKAFHAFEEEDYGRALVYIDGASDLIKELQNDDLRSRMIKATNDQLAGISNLHLGHIYLADSLFASALAKIGRDENRLRPYIYRGQAEVAIEQDRMEQALRLLNQVEEYFGSAAFEDLKLPMYSTYSKYYWKIGDFEKAKSYDLLAKNLQVKKTKEAKELSDLLFAEMFSSKEEYKHLFTMIGIVALSLCFALVLFLFYLVALRKSQKAKFEQLQKLFVKEKEEIHAEQSQKVLLVEDSSREAKDINISKETEERLLHEIQKLEDELFFLDKDIKLSTMANSLNTNTRYISYIIRKYKDQGFYSYIQKCRVQYIINRIRIDPGLLDCKLAYLADMAGFISPSKFSVAFKEETGLSPSAFIQFTKKEKGSIERRFIKQAFSDN